MKIVINKCYGGFSLSESAAKELGLEDVYDSYNTLKRNDPKLVEVIERMGKAANGKFADLQIVEIPDDVDWKIEEYDGLEWVSEVHRTWSYG